MHKIQEKIVLQTNKIMGRGDNIWQVLENLKSLNILKTEHMAHL